MYKEYVYNESGRLVCKQDIKDYRGFYDGKRIREGWRISHFYRLLIEYDEPVELQSIVLYEGDYTVFEITFKLPLSYVVVERDGDNLFYLVEKDEITGDMIDMLVKYFDKVDYRATCKCR